MEINREINKGVAFAVFEGTGGHHLWGTHEYDSEEWIYYHSWNIKLLRNSVYPIILTSGARLAKFDEGRECFNWVFLSGKHGGVASIGSTGLCWTGHGRNVTEFYLGNLHLLFQEYRNSAYLGDMWRNAIISYLKSFNWKEKVEKAFHIKAAEELVLFGDPTLKLNKPGVLEKTGGTLYVGGSGLGNYSSIQEAVDDAVDGDTIIVLEGIYHENVTVTKELTVISRNATLIGYFNLESSSTIDGFNILGWDYSIKCLAPSFILKNSEIESYYGVILEEAAHGGIYNNSFSKCKYALLLEESSNCLIKENKFCDNWYGVWAEASNQLIIENSNFSTNRWYTLWLDRCDGSSIQNNAFHKNWYSVFLYHTDDCRIERNKILYNEHGPQIVASYNNILRNNDICFNEHYGIYTGNRSKNNQILSNNKVMLIMPGMMIEIDGMETTGVIILD